MNDRGIIHGRYPNSGFRRQVVIYTSSIAAVLFTPMTTVNASGGRTHAMLSQEIYVTADASPNPYHSTDQISIWVNANWDQYGGCEDQELCEPGSVEVDISGSDGFEDSGYGDASSGSGEWSFSDPDAAAYGETVTYYIDVTASFWDEETDQEVDSYGETATWVQSCSPEHHRRQRRVVVQWIQSKWLRHFCRFTV